MRQQEAKLKHHNFAKYTSAYYCAIVSARMLSNGGVLAGNKLMSGSIGGARCYVRPPLNHSEDLSNPLSMWSSNIYFNNVHLFNHKGSNNKILQGKTKNKKQH